MKKVIYFLMAGILACQFMVTNVLAAGELITPDDVVAKSNEHLRYVFDISDTTYAPLKNDSTKKQFVFTDGDKESLYYPYETEYFEYSNDKGVTKADEISDTLTDSLVTELIMIGAYKSLGCTDDQVRNILSWFVEDSGTVNSTNYDKYGVVLESDDYTISDDTGEATGTYVKYFKFSFEKTKLQNVINDFSSKMNPNYVNAPPTITFGTTSADYITIAAKILDIDNLDNSKNCNIYRSEEEDGEYKLIGTVACDGSNYLYDKDVVKGKKYFYKAGVVGNDKLSDVYSATAVTAKSTPSDNPDTGMSMAYVLGALILVLTFATAIVFDRDKIEVK